MLGRLSTMNANIHIIYIYLYIILYRTTTKSDLKLEVKEVLKGENLFYLPTADMAGRKFIEQEDNVKVELPQKETRVPIIVYRLRCSAFVRVSNICLLCVYEAGKRDATEMNIYCIYPYTYR